jgi:hypothetical protein
MSASPTHRISRASFTVTTTAVLGSWVAQLRRHREKTSFPPQFVTRLFSSPRFQIIIISLDGNNSCANLYLNERDCDKANGGARLAAWSEDAGITFTRFQVTTVVDPVTSRWTGAVAGLQRLTYATESERSRILLSHPNNPTARENLTIHVSYDEGATWSSGKLLDAGPSCYSDLTKLSNGNAAIVYENGNVTAYDFISFVVFNTSWIDEQ